MKTSPILHQNPNNDSDCFKISWANTIKKIRKKDTVATVQNPIRDLVLDLVLGLDRGLRKERGQESVVDTRTTRLKVAENTDGITTVATITLTTNNMTNNRKRTRSQIVVKQLGVVSLKKLEIYVSTK